MQRSRQVTKDFARMVVFVAVLLLGVQATTALEVGDPAPDFTLPSTMGGPITLSQFRGKNLVLLEFYGADFSPV